MIKEDKQLIFMVGNIGSGKTTWIRKHRKPHQVAVSRDDLRYMLGAGDYIYEPLLEPLIWAVNKFTIKKLIREGFGVIVDGVAVKKDKRLELIRYAKKHGYRIIAVVMPRYSQKDCVDRRMSNNHGNFSREVWEGVWNKFDSITEKPSKKEGIDKIIWVKRRLNEN